METMLFKFSGITLNGCFEKIIWNMVRRIFSEQRCHIYREVGEVVFFFEIIAVKNIDFTLPCHTSPLNHENEIFESLNNHENKIFRKARYVALNNSFEMENPLIREEGGLKIKFFLVISFLILHGILLVLS